MTQEAQDVEHDRVELLLPWFVNKTLDVEEHESVQRHVDACTACRESVMLLSSLSDVVKEDATIPIVPEPDSDKLLALVDQEKPTGHDPFRGWRGLVAAAAILLLVLGKLATNVDDTQNPDYLTATSMEQQGGYVLSMQFDPELTVATQRQILDRLKATDVVSVGNERTFRITVVQPEQTAVEFDAYLSSIEAIEGVAHVEWVGTTPAPETKP